METNLTLLSTAIAACALRVWLLICLSSDKQVPHTVSLARIGGLFKRGPVHLVTLQSSAAELSAVIGWLLCAHCSSA
jgi:hypothetical protein